MARNSIRSLGLFGSAAAAVVIAAQVPTAITSSPEGSSPYPRANRGHTRSPWRGEEHERLQSAVKRERDHSNAPTLLCTHLALAALQGDTNTRIPLAGCLTPRALKPMRDARKAARNVPS